MPDIETDEGLQARVDLSDFVSDYTERLPSGRESSNLSEWTTQILHFRLEAARFECYLDNTRTKETAEAVELSKGQVDQIASSDTQRATVEVQLRESLIDEIDDQLELSYQRQTIKERESALRTVLRHMSLTWDDAEIEEITENIRRRQSELRILRDHLNFFTLGR